MLAKPHANNSARLQILESFGILDTAPEKTYDDITGLTAELLEAPICMVSLVDKDRQWFKSTVGLGGMCESELELSVCAHAVAQDSYLEIEDTLQDPRTADNPLCHGNPPVRFYAGAILRTFDGWPLGTLCVLDEKPRKLTDLQRRVLGVHAKSVTHHLELTRALVNQSRNVKAGVVDFPMPQIDPDLYADVRAKFAGLTPRENEIAKLILSGTGNLTSKGIARTLDISPRTVDHHRASIFKKMGVDSVAELIALCLKAGIR